MGVKSPYLRGNVNSGPGHTQFMREWDQLRDRNPNARLFALDIQPYETSQTQSREDVLCAGGFSDAVFVLMDAFIRGEMGAGQLIGAISNIDL